MMVAISVESLRKTFRVKKRLRWFQSRWENADAVKSISFEVPKGESLAFIGPNGAGKSTTIKILTGILHPTSGTANVLSLSPWKHRQKLAFKIGSVFGQKSQLWMHLPPVDAFHLLSKIYEIPRHQYLDRLKELTRLFELEEVMKIATRKLSLGQRMRCEVAASLLHRPEIIFLDEPTIGLDPLGKGIIRDLIQKVNHEEGVTVFLTSHDSGDIEKLSKRVMIINHGEIVLDGSVDALRSDYLKIKEIDLRLSQSQERNSTHPPGIQRIKSSEYEVKLSVDTSIIPVDRAISEIMKSYPVEDITIQNPSMEDIISRIYAKQKRK